MSSGRFFVPRGTLVASHEVLLPPAIVQQVCFVLRLHAGDLITLLDDSGQAFTVQLVKVDHKQVIGKIVEQHSVASEPQTHLTLYQGMLKAAKFEWIIQKGTEIGISRFIPFASARSLKGLDEASHTKQQRWQTIAREAAEQCERGRIPAISPPLTFFQVIEEMHQYDYVLMPWEIVARESAAPLSVASALGYTEDKAIPAPSVPHIAILIGPEGGFTAEETLAAQQHGASIISLGPRILRAETAALVTAALVLAAFHEME